jgi:hypothetical protein
VERAYQERQLEDGSSFRIVKAYCDPADLEREHILLRMFSANVNARHGVAVTSASMGKLGQTAW